MRNGSTRYPRRRFLKDVAVTGTALGMPAFWQQVSQAEATRRAPSSNARDHKLLVVIELSGGNDGLNTVIPVRDPEYAKNRPSLAVSENNALRLNDDLAFHPSLQPLMKRWESGGMKVVENVGYPNPNRSHFRSMDIWHSGELQRGPTTGWLGRMVDQHPELLACHVGDGGVPLAVRRRRDSTPTLARLEDYQALQNDTTFRSTLSTDELVNAIAQRQKAAVELSNRLAKVKDKLPATRRDSLDERLTTILGLIQAGMKQRIYYTSLGGFDTHSGQQFRHAGLLRQLATSLDTFLTRVAEAGLGDQLSILVFSEFGRRVKENGTKGTDHGAAAPLFLLGNSVRGGLEGKAPDLQKLKRGDIVYQIDYRDLYAGILKDWLGLDAKPILGERKAVAGLFKP